MLHRGSFELVLGLFGTLALGCSERTADPRNAPRANVANELPVAAQVAPIGERLLDTTPAPPSAPTAPRVLGITNAPAPVTTTRAPKLRKPGSDENLPSWVPLRGRLTVVEAPDLAENLGLVPKGTTRASQTRISVAESLAASATASSPAARIDPGPRSATWLASNGRVRHGRGR